MFKLSKDLGPLSENTMSDLKIYVGIQHEGATFQLSPDSRRWLQSQDMEPGVRSLFIAKNPQDTFEQTWSSTAPQIVSLLTGLTPPELSTLDTVEFLHPKDESVLMVVDFRQEKRASHG